MKDKRLYISIITAVVFLNFFLSYRFHQTKSNCKSEILVYKNQVFYDSSQIKNLKSIINIYSAFNTLDVKNIIKNNLKKWEGEYHLVVYVNENQCTACLKKVFMDFYLLQGRLAFNNFVIMGDYSNKQNLRSVIKEIDENFEFLDLSLNINDLEMIESPIVFMVNNNLEIDFLLFPDLFPEMRNEYFYDKIEKYISRYNLN